MMKYVLMVVFGLCVCSPVQAGITDDEWQGFLTRHATTYPILDIARVQPEFQSTARSFFQKCPNSQDVLDKTIGAVIQRWISKMGNPTYFALVEGLDPIVRDLKNMGQIQCLVPSVGPNPYKVHGVFNCSAQLPEQP